MNSLNLVLWLHSEWGSNEEWNLYKHTHYQAKLIKDINKGVLFDSLNLFVYKLQKYLPYDASILPGVVVEHIKLTNKHIPNFLVVDCI